MGTTKAPSEPRSALGVWQARALHTITCPSGQRLRIRIPGLPQIVERGDLPDHLAAIAVLELTEPGGALAAIARETASAPEGGRDMVLERMREVGAFEAYLVALAVQEIEVAPDEWAAVDLAEDGIDGIPDDDLSMVSDIVQRRTDRDAVGVKIGVETIDRFATFREEHGCDALEGGADCARCQALVERFSSLRVVGV